MPGFGRSYKAKKTSGKKKPIKNMRGKKKPAAQSARVRKGKK
jgi:hypothetical protein